MRIVLIYPSLLDLLMKELTFDNFLDEVVLVLGQELMAVKQMDHLLEK